MSCSWYARTIRNQRAAKRSEAGGYFAGRRAGRIFRHKRQGSVFSSFSRLAMEAR